MPDSISSLSAMFKDSEMAILINEPDGKICFASPAASKMFNYSLPEMKKKCRHELFDSFSTAHPLTQEKNPFCEKLVGIKKNGEKFLCEIYSSAIINENHTLTSTVILDKSDAGPEEKEATEKLRQSEKHYRFLFENNPLPACIYDTEAYKFLEVNDAALEYFGYNREDLLKLNLPEIILSEDLAKLKGEIDKASLSSKPHTSIWKIKRKNGEIVYIESRSNRINYKGRNARLVLAQDITKRVLTEIELKISNERYRLATKASFDAIWDANLLTDKMFLGEGFETLFGYSSENNNVPGSTWTEHIHPDDKQRVIEEHNAILADKAKNFWSDEYRYLRADGSVAHVIDRGVIIRDQDGKPLRMVGAMQDNTEQKYQRDIESLELRVFEISSTPGIPFSEVLNILLLGIEAIHPEMLSSVLQLTDDNAIRNLAGPSLPKEYLQMIDGISIGPNVGSCGTAMYRKEPVIVSDIDHDPLWEPYKQIAQHFKLKACWSVPIIHSNGLVIGSFAIYYQQPKSPSEKEWNTILRIRNLIRLLMENNNSFEQIKLTNERFDIVTNATHDLIWDWNLETNEFYRDPKGLQKVYGFTNNEPIKHINNWLGRIHPEDLEKIQNIIFNIVNARNENIFDVEYRFKKEDGNYAYIYDRGYILRNEDGKAYRMIGAAQDITERKKLEAELLNQQKAISQATISTQEKERTEISKELHDNVNQVLTTTKLYLDLAMTNSELKDELIAKSSKNVISAIKEIRQLSQSLMIPSLGDLGLIDSIEDLIENMNTTKKINAVFLHKKIDETLLNENQKLTLFRIVQEALNNVVKHAEATETLVELCEENNMIKLLIKDDGKGFDPNAVKKGAGLNNIRNRVYLLNGSLTVNTQLNKGSTLVVELPQRI
ncbi:MAG TPA: PAS domain-containing protein [Chitinophagaceae bacterium]|jgi:PAS domain S-box-containing protein|nr:PAS domain-containing protein [Chitinophagaceae bacterium]